MISDGLRGNSEGPCVRQYTPEPTPQCSTPGRHEINQNLNVRWVDRDDGSPRMFGSILQTGHSLYVVAEDSIWNKHGIKMLSPVGSTHYKKVGYIIGGAWSRSKWFHPDMLGLRR